MFYEEKDYLMREIKRIAYYIAKRILKKNTVEYDFQSVTQDSDTDLLHKVLMALLAENEINQAENALFEALEADKRMFMEVALDFYSRLNDFSDEQLAAADFSRQEINEGLDEVLRIYQVPALNIPH